MEALQDYGKYLIYTLIKTLSLILNQSKIRERRRSTVNILEEQDL